MIRMKLAMLRHTPGYLWGWKTYGGLLLAITTIVMGMSQIHDAAIVTNRLCLAFASWTLGWILAPIQTGGGGDETVMPEHFALLPIAPRKLATDLLAAAFVGLGPAFTAIAFAGVFIFGAQLGLVPALIAIPAMLLQLVFTVLLSRVTIGAAGAAMKSRLGLEFAALQYAFLVMLTFVGWVPFAALNKRGQLQESGDILVGRLPHALSRLVHMLPTGWGPVAVNAAHRSDWRVVFAGLAGLLALCVVLLLAWARLLTARLTTPATVSTGHMGVEDQLPLERFLPDSPLGGAIGREVRTWFREPRYALELRIAILSGLLIAAVPMLAGWWYLVPWAGCITAIMAGSCACNIYGLEGSALWITLTTPDAERTDVRGKQWALIVIFAPVVLALTVILTVWNGESWVWPWVLAAVPALLGGAAGLMILVAIFGAVPVPESSRRSGNLMAGADNTGSNIVMICSVPLVALPAVGVVWLGSEMAGAWKLAQWIGVPVGVATGALLFWWGGRIATRQLQRHGPELLTLMKYGKQETARSRPTGIDAVPAGWQRNLVRFCWWFSWIPLLPQGLAPALVLLVGSDVKSWFLPLYLPAEVQWPVAIAMIALGLVMIGVALFLTKSAEQEHTLVRRPV